MKAPEGKYDEHDRILGGIFLWTTCIELIMVLRANTVAESRRVDWLSKVPCVSISSTATYRKNSLMHVYTLMVLRKFPLVFSGALFHFHIQGRVIGSAYTNILD